MKHFVNNYVSQSMSKKTKYEQLIETARKLFWYHGIRKISIEEICRESNVSKMTFYKYFKNRNDLVKVILDILFDEAMHRYNEIMESDIPFPEKVKQQIQLKLEGTTNLSEAFLMDIHQFADKEIVDYFNEKRDITIQMVLKDYLNAQNQGYFRRDIKPEFILFFFNHMYELAENPKLLKLYNSPQSLILELVNFFFYGIMPNHEGE